MKNVARVIFFLGLGTALVFVSGCDLFKSETSEHVVQTQTVGTSSSTNTTKIARNLSDKSSPEKIQGLSLWLKADSIKGGSNGSAVTQWLDSSGNGMDLKQADEPRAPHLALGSINGQPTVKFNASNQQLEKKDVLGSKLFSDKSGTIMIVLKPGDDNKNEGFSWGGCNNNRFMLNLDYDKRVMFIFGVPQIDEISGYVPADWSGKVHVVTFDREENILSVYIDGVMTGHGPGKSKLDTGVSSSLLLGKGHCGHPFSGEIAEVVLFKSGVPAASRIKVESYLASKYGVVLYN